MKSNLPITEYLTRNQLAERLGCDPMSVYRFTKLGVLTPHVFGRTYLYHPDEAKKLGKTRAGSLYPLNRPPVRKLSDRDIRNIRTGVKKGKHTQAYYARKYGVDPGLVCRIVHKGSRKKTSQKNGKKV